MIQKEILFSGMQFPFLKVGTKCTVHSASIYGKSWLSKYLLAWSHILKSIFSKSISFFQGLDLETVRIHVEPSLVCLYM